MKEKNFVDKKTGAFGWVLLVVLAVYSISLLIPLAWGVITSLKSRSDFVLNSFGLPNKWMFSNYPKAFSNFMVTVRVGAEMKKVYLGKMLLNSLIYNAGAVTGATIVPCITAYLAAKYRFRFGRVIHTVVIIVMIIPIVGAMPSMLNLMRSTGLYNTFVGLWIQKSNFCGMYFLVFYGTFKSLSWEYAEAAFIDGASHTKVMFQIMLPLVKTVIGTVALLYFMAFWNDYQTPLVYMPAHPTAAYGLLVYSKTSRVNSVPDQLTGCMIILFPMLMLFLMFNKKMMGNLTMGGLKG